MIFQDELSLYIRRARTSASSDAPAFDGSSGLDKGPFTASSSLAGALRVSGLGLRASGRSPLGEIGGSVREVVGARSFVAGVGLTAAATDMGKPGVTSGKLRKVIWNGVQTVEGNGTGGAVQGEMTEGL